MPNKLDRSPASTLARIGTDYGTVRENIARVFESASADDRQAGAAWYSVALGIARELHALGAPSVEHAATAIAHLSPRVNWDVNVKAAYAVIDNGNVPSQVPGASIARAVASLATDNPLDTLNGPKTHAFARNILGDTNSVTVDVWALRVALGYRDDLDKVIKRAGVYDAIASVYRDVASAYGIAPSTLQAVTWCAIRPTKVDN